MRKTPYNSPNCGTFCKSPNQYSLKPLKLYKLSIRNYHFDYEPEERQLLNILLSWVIFLTIPTYNRLKIKYGKVWENKSAIKQLSCTNEVLILIPIIAKIRFIKTKISILILIRNDNLYYIKLKC